MLLTLEIKNLAIVESVSLQLGRGLSAITGETGAGKSILVDALGLLSGSRADPGLVRVGAERAEVSAEFAPSPALLLWLQDNALDEDAGCLLKRVVRRDGPSKAFINGRVVSAAQLAEAAQQLFEIHGQNEHQSLLVQKAQLRSLDELGNHEAALDRLKTLCARVREIDAVLAGFGSEDAATMQDFLSFQIDELSALDLSASALADLNRALKRLSAMESLRSSAAKHGDTLSGGEHALLRDLARMQQDFSRLTDLEPAFKDVPELLSQARVNLEEVAATLRHYLSAVEADPAEQRRIEERLDRWHELARKHRVAAAELPERLVQLRLRLHDLNLNMTQISQLNVERNQIKTQYLHACETLSDARAEVAERLCVRVRELLAELRMAQAQFQVALERDPARLFDPQGQDRAEFLVNFNLGQELKALRKVASGGELSRMSLCLRLAAIESISVPTVVFDEVDAGVGGAVAESIGKLLRRLGESRQVFTVTHLPQVAVQAHQQLTVSKRAENGTLITEVRALNPSERREEIARMLGGEELTQATREHAREMLVLAEATKK